MALGDGTGWDETTPVDGTVGIYIDDHILDLRKGNRLRMNNEHEWPSSQTGSAQAGMHKFITLQEQAAKPTLAGTQQAAVYVKTDLGLYFENSAGTELKIMDGTGVPGPIGNFIYINTVVATTTPTLDAWVGVDLATWIGSNRALCWMNFVNKTSAAGQVFFCGLRASGDTNYSNIYGQVIPEGIEVATASNDVAGLMCFANATGQIEFSQIQAGTIPAASMPMALELVFAIR